MSIFNKETEYKMDLKSADRILQNVFEDVGEKPNTVPFDKIVLRCKYNGFTFDLCIILAVLLFVLTLLSPLKLKADSDDERKNFGVAFHEQYGNELLITLNRKDIDLSECFFSDADGNVTRALYFNSLGKTLAFPMPDEEVTITITEESGGVLKLLFTPMEQ